MARRLPKRRASLLREEKPNIFVQLLRTLFLAALAYFSAALVYLTLVHISELPRGPLWDVSFQGPFLFVMLVVVVCVLVIPFFQKEWDPALRTFTMFAAIFMIAYAIFRNSGYIDPDLPMQFLLTHVVAPLRRLIGY